MGTILPDMAYSVMGIVKGCLQISVYFSGFLGFFGMVLIRWKGFMRDLGEGKLQEKDNLLHMVMLALA